MNTLWLYTIACTPEEAVDNIREDAYSEDIEYIQRDYAKITNLKELRPNFKIFYIEVGVFGEPEPE